MRDKITSWIRNNSLSSDVCPNQGQLSLTFKTSRIVPVYHVFHWGKNLKCLPVANMVDKSLTLSSQWGYETSN